MRKRLAAVVVILGAFFGAGTASAWWMEPSLNTVASTFASRSVAVKCYTADEPDSPYFNDAWGYVYLLGPRQKFMHLDEQVCAGARNVNDAALPEWQRALGVLVLTHESYHMRKWGAWGNEGKVECKAIRHWKVAARMLGATPETIEALWASALTLHYKLADYYDAWSQSYPYRDPSCVVPRLIPEDS